MIVPVEPASRSGSPFWFSVPTEHGDGALIQPIMVAARWSVADWACSLLLLALALWADSCWPPFERDVRPQLNDPSIMYPHTPPLAQQVPSWLLWRLSVALPLLLLLPLAALRPCGVPATRLLNELWLGLVTSIATAFLFTCVVKVHVGRLRPDFLSRCMPVDGSCTGEAAAVREGRKSFPSGHSTLVWAGLGFVSIAYAARLADLSTPRLGSLYKVMVAAAPAMVALGVALSRVADYWHHWQDVLVGSLIGCVAAYGAWRLRFPSPVAAVPSGRSRLTPHVCAEDLELLANRAC